MAKNILKTRNKGILKHKHKENKQKLTNFST